MSIKKIKTIFIGTPDFAVPGLRALIESPGFEVAGVVTQPDKKVGRKQAITPPPVKFEAVKNSLPIYQPEKISTFDFRNLSFELIVLIAYSQILPPELLKLPKYGAVNVHGSLLPKYRGSSCIQYPIMNGDRETGITIMKMDAGLDTGPIIKQYQAKITDSDTAGSLSDKLAKLSAEVLPTTLLEYISGALMPAPQASEGASFAPELKKQDGEIDWSKPAEEIERFIRAMTPWPSAWSRIADRGSRIVILGTKPQAININDYKIGELFVHDGRLAVQGGGGVLVIEKLQLEGKKPVSGEEFINGHKNMIGTVLE